MSTARYFVTEKDEAAKNWEMVERVKSLTATVARLEDELHGFSLDWSLLAKNTLISSRNVYYRIEGENIEILSVDAYQTRDQNEPKFKVDNSVKIKHFDSEKIKALLTDLSESRKELESAKAQLGKLGVKL